MKLDIPIGLNYLEIKRMCLKIIIVFTMLRPVRRKIKGFSFRLFKKSMGDLKSQMWKDKNHKTKKTKAQNIQTDIIRQQ